MVYFDTHAHYTDAAFDPDRDDVLQSLAKCGVTHVICPGCDVESSEKAARLSEDYPFLYFAAGLHPENLENTVMSDLDKIAELAEYPACVAIGEIGLDYYWLKTPEERAVSRRFFDAQLSLAEKLNLPVLIHDRDAHRDTLEICRAHPRVRGVFHCCSLSAEDALSMEKCGFFFSFTGNITFPNAKRAAEVIARLPLSRLMTETDSPYMAPVPFRGSRCDSRYVYRVAERIAEIRGIPADTAARELYRNAMEFFDIKEQKGIPSQVLGNGEEK